MRYIIAIFLSVLQASSLVCMVNDNNGSHEDHNAPYSQEYEIDWDHIFDDSDDEGIDIFDDLEQYEVYVQENDLFAGDSSDTQHAREKGSNRSHEVHEAGSTDCESASVVHTTRSDDARNITGLLSDKDRAFLENITYDERIREDEYQDEPPLGSDLDEGFQEDLEGEYIIREYIDRPSAIGVSDAEMTKDENDGEYVTQCPVQGCDFTPRRMQKGQVRDVIRVHENMYHTNKYEYICRSCNWSTYNWQSLSKHMQRVCSSYKKKVDTKSASDRKQNGERYKDTYKKRYVKCEYINRTSLFQIPSNNIIYDSNKGVYQVVCAVQNCHKTFEAKSFDDAKRRARDHENADHKKRRWIHDNEQRNEPSLGKDLDENYQDTYGNKYITREYVDRPSIKNISEDEITQGERDGNYIVQCPVQGCDYTPRRARKKELKDAIRIHGNACHAHRYRYICRCCGNWSTYNWNSFLTHKEKCYIPCRKKSDTGSITDRGQNGGRYKDTQKKHYIEREYIDRPPLSRIPSENITYDSNKRVYQVICPVQNCDVTFKRKRLGDAKTRAQNHENSDHKKKYICMCNYCDFYGYGSNVINQHVSRKHRSLQDVHDNSGYSLYSYTGKQAACSSSSDTLPQETDQTGIDRNTNVHWSNSNEEQELQILDYVLQQAWDEYTSAHASEVYSTAYQYTTSSNVAGESSANKRNRDESETEPCKHMCFQLEDLFE